MRILSCENFALQSSTITPAADLIVKCGSTGKQFQYIGGQWKEYFAGVQAGGSIKVSPLAQGVPACSIQDVKAIDSPFSNDVVDNYCKINTTMTQTAANTFGWGFVQQHTTTVTVARVICTVASGTVQIGIYNSTGTLIAKSVAVTASVGFLSLPITMDASGSAIAGIGLTGGNLYYFGIAMSSATCALAGFSGMSSTSFATNPLQITAATAIPNTVTLNSGTKTVGAYVCLVSGV